MKTQTISLLLKTTLVCTVVAFAATAAQANDTAVRDMQSQFGLVQNQAQTQYDESAELEEELIRTLDCGKYPCGSMNIAMVMMD